MTDRHEDLVRLLEALGMGTHARPISSAEVFDQCLEEISNLRATIDLIREEANKDNAPYGRSDSLALYRIRYVLGIPRYGIPENKV